MLQRMRIGDGILIVRDNDEQKRKLIEIDEKYHY